MKFIFPCAEYEAEAAGFIREFYDHGSGINGTGGLNRFLEDSSYAVWLEKVMGDIDIANIPKGKVPAYTYFYADDGRIIGMVNIRLCLNDYLRREGGHIGYCIRPTERRKGHATNMLRQALDFCGKIGLNNVLITCDKANIASAKVIKACGGVLENEVSSSDGNEIIQRYYINESHIMDNGRLSIAQMLQMQRELCEKNKANWGEITPETARSQLLWMIGEVGEALDILKKCGEDGIMNDAAIRQHFTEEMCDVLMYISKVLLCYGISAQDVTAAYTGKHHRNMKRDYSRKESVFADSLREESAL